MIGAWETGGWGYQCHCCLAPVLACVLAVPERASTTRQSSAADKAIYRAISSLHKDSLSPSLLSASLHLSLLVFNLSFFPSLSAHPSVFVSLHLFFFVSFWP